MLQHNTTRHDTTRHDTTRHGTARHNPAPTRAHTHTHAPQAEEIATPTNQRYHSHDGISGSVLIREGGESLLSSPALDDPNALDSTTDVLGDVMGSNTEEDGLARSLLGSGPSERGDSEIEKVEV